MQITADLLRKIELYGARNYPVRHILLLECNSKIDRAFLKAEFANPGSEVNEAWDKGFVEHESQVDEYLEKALENPGEGANDVARALDFRRRKRQEDDLKNELFGV